VRHLVEMHGGTISVFSEGEGKGSTFSVDLPLAQRAGSSVFTESGSILDGAARAGNDAASARAGFAGKLEGLRILVVDDEPDALDMLVSLFAQAGAEVASGASARQALDLLAIWSPSVIVTDVGMPGEDGYQLIGKIRSMKPEQGGDIPAVALTAYATAEDKARALSSGFQAHVAKPVEPTEIISVIAKLAPRARVV
jgi:CheY-like chemotaxis protein